MYLFQVSEALIRNALERVRVALDLLFHPSPSYTPASAVMHRRFPLFRAYPVCLPVPTQRAVEGEAHPEDGAAASVPASPTCGEVGFLLIKSNGIQVCRYRHVATTETRITSREEQPNSFFRDNHQATR